MLNRYFITVLLLATTFIFGQKSVPQDEVKAKIEVEKVENNIKITGTAENLTNIIKSAFLSLLLFPGKGTVGIKMVRSGLK